MLITSLLAFLCAYLLGSIPFGFLAGRLRGVDIRREGSGNIGATNALRVLGKSTGYAVFVLDFLKGLVGVGACAWIAGGMEPAMVAAAIGVILGHNFPVWLSFKGGKGIATSAGVIIALFPPLAFLLALVMWVVLFFTTRYVSLASMAAAATLPAVVFVLAVLGRASWLLAVVAGAMALLAILRHRGNIQRLLDGTEPRFERRKNKVGIEKPAGT